MAYERKIYLCLSHTANAKTKFKSIVGFVTTEKEVADKWFKDVNDGDPAFLYEVMELDNLHFQNFWIESVQDR